MAEEVLFELPSTTQKPTTQTFSLGNGLVLTISNTTAMLYRGGAYVRSVDLEDTIARKLFIIEIIEQGAKKSHVAKALNMSRQTIHNYEEIKKHFGTEGLVRGYTLSESKSKRRQREIHADKREGGNQAEQVAQIRKEKREQRESENRNLNFTFEGEGKAWEISKEEKIYSDVHEWKETRYAGVIVYVAALMSVWKWIELVMGRVGRGYQICMVFVLMAARNIRSIEQLKNVRLGEAGMVLGLTRLPSLPKIWKWFYEAARKNISESLLWDYFRYQIRAGLVSIWLWFIDGHLLPYTGKEKTHHSYHTQRRMPVPGRTNIVCCDENGRIVDFQIQEGKGDLRSHIKELVLKWEQEVEGRPIMVFDREGNGIEFFYGLVEEEIAFVTWEKNANKEKLASIGEEKFTEEFEYNGKQYSIYEEEKVCVYKPVDTEMEEGKEKEYEYRLRRICIWNKSTNRRVSGLAWGDELSSDECARAILSRWGASENTFKHLNTRHPLHYHPGFEMVESEKQEIGNPEIKKKENLIKVLKTQLGKLYKGLAKSEGSVNKDGSVRKNSKQEGIKQEIEEKESRLAIVQEEKKRLPERIDISELENYRSFKKIDNEGKNLFDFVTTSVWNARKQMVDWLRPHYDRENEIVDLFYAITECHGWIKSTETEVIVRLEPLQQPKRRAAQKQLCRKLTSLGAQTPTGKWLSVEVGTSPI